MSAESNSILQKRLTYGQHIMSSSGILVSTHRSISIRSVLVQEMLHGDPPIELIFGAKKDETFGMILLFGVGGVQTEMYKDTAMCVDSWEDQDILKNMIGSIKAQQLLDGYRGSKSIEREKLFQFAKQLETASKGKPTDC